MAPSARTNLYDLRRSELVYLLGEWGFSEYYADQLWSELYRHGHLDFESMSSLRPDLQRHLKQQALLVRPSVKVRQASLDGQTRKYLLSLTDGEAVETVVMHYPGRATVCVSTQVGCAMGCVFCATGQMGYLRNLSPGEIVAQVLHMVQEPDGPGNEIRNIVFMGMGEPLHNYDATMAAIDILTDDKGLAIGPRYITVSTVGLPRQIRRLADEQRPINLAVSLHAATDSQRTALVPVNQRWGLDEIISACRYYISKRQRRIFFEWALIAGQNDTVQQAHSVGQLLQGLEAHVNLIPLNPTAGYQAEATSSDNARRFQETLAEYGLPSTIRQRRGIDIQAGCGQLRINSN